MAAPIEIAGPRMAKAFCIYMIADSIGSASWGGVILFLIMILIAGLFAPAG